jgi:hypothetical protein
MVQENEPGDQPPSSNQNPDEGTPGEGLPNDGLPNDGLIDRLRSGQLSLPLLGGIAAVIVVGIILLVVALGGGGSESTPEDSEHAGLKTPEADVTVEATIDLNRPTATGVGQLETIGAGDRFVIASIGVDAAISYHKVPPSGAMPDPDGPDDIAYYDFSNFEGFGGAPGLGGNGVFSGHVDSGRKACKNGTVPPPCTAVLWDLEKLKKGDIIEVRINGATHKYAVTSNEPVSESGNFDPIVRSTQTESITIISCNGDFNRTTGRYDDRQVVTAEKVPA